MRTPIRQSCFIIRNRTTMDIKSIPGTPVPTPWMSKTPLSAILIPFPIELPDELLEEWDSLQNKTQYAAFHYDLGTRRLLRENGISIKSCPIGSLFTALCGYSDVLQWCVRNKIQLHTGTHWLIYDYHDGRAYVGHRCTAMKCLEEQALPTKG